LYDVLSNDCKDSENNNMSQIFMELITYFYCAFCEIDKAPAMVDITGAYRFLRALSLR